MSDSIPLIVVNSPIPYNGLPALHDSVQQLLFVTDCSGNWGMRDVVKADYLHGVTSLAEQMIRQIEQTRSFNY